MIKNFIKTAFRNLLRNKGFTAINILGLSLGLASCLFIVLYVVDELGYDRFNTQADRIYRVDDDIKYNDVSVLDALSPAPLAATLTSMFPEIENTVRFRQRGSIHVRKDGQDQQERKVTYCDNSLFSVFNLPVIEGNQATMLSAPDHIVITESTARRYFNRTNVTGQTLLVNGSKTFKVSGVIKDIPRQSHFNFDFFISMPTLAESRETSWTNSNFQTYLLLRPGSTPAKILAAFPQIVKTYVGGQMQDALHVTYDDFIKSGNHFSFTLMPLLDIHLHSAKVGDMGQNGSIEYIYIFVAIAVFILLIACVNFINLSTARSAARAREIGMRKVLGSSRRQLIFQFLTESIMITLAAALIAAAIVADLLPFYNQLSGKDLVIGPQFLMLALPFLLVAILLIGCLAGAYPALLLSAIQPAKVLKGKFAGSLKSRFMRSFLVVFQFSISVFLIIGTLVIYNQLSYIRHKDLGFNRERVVVVQNVNMLGSKAVLFKQQVKRLPAVVNATLTGYTPVNGWRNSGSIFTDPVMSSGRSSLSQLWSVDEDYIPTLGMKLAAGRNFSDQMPSDSSAMIINEAAVRLLGISDPVNKSLYRPLDDGSKLAKEFRIVGVIKDFNFSSLRDNVTPLILKYEPNNSNLSVRISAGEETMAMAQLKSTWARLSGNQQFSYTFMEEDFNQLYHSEQRMGQLSVVFTALAIVIACLGMFGLAAYAAGQRLKEIGIRKVLGAGVAGVVYMLLYDFIKLVLLAIVLASVPAWWVMQRWLQNFAYREDVPWWSIAVAGLLTVFIALITVSFQSVNAALMNPAKSLRSE